MKVLLVEDNVPLVTLLRKVLERQGLQVSVAHDGIAGWEKVKTERPEVVISDIMMPKLTGLELTRMIRGDLEVSDTYIILLTALDQLENKITGLESGADEYLVKPVRHEELATRVKVAQRLVTLQNRLKEQNALLQKVNDELLAANQQKDRFLGMAAHDLRSPMTVIRGWTEMFEDGMLGALDHEQRKAIRSIYNQVDSMLELVDDLLDISKIESGRIELDRNLHDVREILGGLVEDTTILAGKKGIELQLVVADCLPSVPFDAARLRQAVGNLLSNALKFTGPGGRIEVGARAAGGDLEISVSDTGVGIPEHEMKNLFQEFVRLSSRPTGGEKGTGLGLAIAKKIVTQHGGRIWANSAVGEGTTFRFSIPPESNAERGMRDAE